MSAKLRHFSNSKVQLAGRTLGLRELDRLLDKRRDQRKQRQKQQRAAARAANDRGHQ